MSEYFTSAKHSLSQLSTFWKKQDPIVKRLDLFTFLQLVLFITSYLTFSIADVKGTVINAALLIFPIIMAVYTYIVRMKIKQNPDTQEAIFKEYLLFFVIFTVGVLLTFAWGFYIDSFL